MHVHMYMYMCIHVGTGACTHGVWAVDCDADLGVCTY